MYIVYTELGTTWVRTCPWEGGWRWSPDPLVLVRGKRCKQMLPEFLDLSTQLQVSVISPEPHRYLGRSSCISQLFSP